MFHTPAHKQHQEPQTSKQISRPVLGKIVHYPADRGDPAGTGSITWVGSDVHTNVNGVKFVWVEVRQSITRRKAVWASHRLGYRID